MSLLDGKYEIVSQKIINSRETIFKALAPDGNSLKIIWYEFDNFADEQQFEIFRKLIRKLRKENLAAVYDIVSRPRANYIAWLDSNNLKQANSNKKIDTLLAEFGYNSKMADIRLNKKNQQIYYLNFNPEELIIESSTKLTPVPPNTKTNSKALYSYALSAGLFVFASLIFINALKQSANNQTVVLD
ncbi:MAG TPA: hypothetical protein ENK21_08215, partial [Trueperaceae bacterium]|nr:hypothetical protein [Trueperaceae bacterium]